MREGWCILCDRIYMHRKTEAIVMHTIEGRYEVFDIKRLGKRVFDTLKLAMINAEIDPPNRPTSIALQQLKSHYSN